MLIRIEAVVSQRQQRVAEEIRHVLANIIQRGELKDPQLMDLSVTVSEVRVSPDLKNATAFIAPLGGGSSEELATAMNRAAPFIRMRLGKELSLKYLPKVIFEAEQDSDNLYKEALALATAEANSSREKARLEIDAQRDDALNQLKNEADNLGNLIVERLLAKK